MPRQPQYRDDFILPHDRPHIRIATRRSALAVTQANSVAQRLHALEPDIETKLVEITTQGDRASAKGVAAAGKGAFIEALEDALAADRADIAVHSMKDVPGDVPDGFALATFGTRADVRDALLTRQQAGVECIGELPPQSRIGTSSLRRQALLLAAYPQLEVVPLRGNVDTRLRRLDAGDVDALLLASAGLDRLGLGQRIDQRLDADLLVPAPGQGALAVEYLAARQDLAELLRKGTDDDVQSAVAAERQVARQLGADCALPLGACCQRATSGWRLVAVVADASRQVLRVELTGTDAPALAAAASARLLAMGAGELLDASR